MRFHPHHFELWELSGELQALELHNILKKMVNMEENVPSGELT